MDRPVEEGVVSGKHGLVDLLPEALPKLSRSRVRVGQGHDPLRGISRCDELDQLAREHVRLARSRSRFDIHDVGATQDGVTLLLVKTS